MQRFLSAMPCLVAAAIWMWFFLAIPVFTLAHTFKTARHNRLGTEDVLTISTSGKLLLAVTMVVTMALAIGLAGFLRSILRKDLWSGPITLFALSVGGAAAGLGLAEVFAPARVALKSLAGDNPIIVAYVTLFATLTAFIGAVPLQQLRDWVSGVFDRHWPFGEAPRLFDAHIRAWRSEPKHSRPRTVPRTQSAVIGGEMLSQM